MSLPPVLPESAPFTPEQRAWVNGYLAGLYQTGAGTGGGAVEASLPSAPAGPEVAILFGSQTGTAQSLAYTLAEKAKGQGMQPKVLDMAEYASLDLPATSNLLVLTSTYGEGDNPDNAQAFWEALEAEDAPRLENTNFSVLALGDTNYEEFCAAGIRFDQRLEALGAKRVHDRTDCDVDYEAPAEAWMEGALAELAKLAPAGANHGAAAVEVELPPVSSTGVSANGAAPKFDKENPFPAKLVTNRVLTGSGSGKETRHYEISLEGSGLTYEVGDALGVLPTNCPGLVLDFLDVTKLDGRCEVEVGGVSLPLQQALMEKLDITKPSKKLLSAIAEKTEDAELTTLLEPEQKTALSEYLWGREIIDLLKDYSPGFTSDELVSLLKPLTPRLYSISSSLNANPEQVHLTVASVRYEGHGRSRKGVCSTFLADRADDAPVPVFVQASHGFRLPEDGETPVIMVGPGTGVAPFRAFLQEREVTQAKGKNWLFFGEQRADTDFFYRDELESWQASGLLTRLDTAFSRDQEHKIYVQHRMLEAGAELYDWLQAGAYFYVCGDASRMAKDVDAALHKVVATFGNLNEAEAASYVSNLKKEKRYLRDVY